MGIVSFSLLAALGANELSGWHLGCHDDADAKIDPTVTERHWAWDGGDTVNIAVPARLHYRGGSGDEVIAHGSAEAIARLRVRNGKITQSCSGRWAQSDLDITLPGRAFRTVAIAGPGTSSA